VRLLLNVNQTVCLTIFRQIGGISYVVNQGHKKEEVLMSKTEWNYVVGIVRANERREFDTAEAAGAKVAQWLDSGEKVYAWFNTPNPLNVQSNRTALLEVASRRCESPIKSEDELDRKTRYWVE
jgi:anti-sigma-K factor RskA